MLAASVSHAISDFIESREIDLVAMSTHGRGASRFLLGSVADKIIRSSNTPVLLFHPQAKTPDDDIVEEEAGAVVALS
jgi:nucleotide-binding universal stress UspA family protein